MELSKVPVWFVVAGGLPTPAIRRQFLQKLHTLILQDENHDPNIEASLTPLRLLYIGCAHGEEPARYVRFLEAAGELWQVRRLNFFGPVPQLSDLLNWCDGIFIDGGNTRTMLAIWKEWDFPRRLAQAIETGKIRAVAGTSAGMICWFQYGITDSWADQYRVIEGLGWLPGIACPHWDSEPVRRKVLYDFLRVHPAIKGIALEDGAVAVFRGDAWVQTWQIRSGARALALRAEKGAIVLTDRSSSE